VRGGDERADAACRATLGELVDRTRPLFAAGRALLPLVDPAVRAPIRLFSLGGEAVLAKIVRGGYSTHRTRPRLGPVAKAALLARTWLTTDTRPPEAPH
jgi:phytoene/squalene synthetase